MTSSPRARRPISAASQQDGGNSASRVTILSRPELDTDGTYSLQTITAAQARDLLTQAGAIHALWRESVAEVVATLLGIEATRGRLGVGWEPRPGDIAIIVDTSTRPAPTIKLLTRTG
jgi:hypothetical protein